MADEKLKLGMCPLKFGNPEQWGNFAKPEHNFQCAGEACEWFIITKRNLDTMEVLRGGCSMSMMGRSANLIRER